MTNILINESREIRYMAYVPEEPKYKVNCGGTHACTCASLAFENGANRDVVDGYDDNCPYRYQSDLEKANRESMPFENLEDREKVLQVLYGHTAHLDLPLNYQKWKEEIKPGIYQVPVEVEVVDNGKCDRWCNDCKAEHWTKCTHRQVARIVQPKEKEESELPKAVIDFATWYSGLDRQKVIKAYERYCREFLQGKEVNQ